MNREYELERDNLLTFLKEHHLATYNHSKRVQGICLIVGPVLELERDQLRQLRIASELHDIGKLKLPVSILENPEKLSDEEWKLIKSHPEEGFSMLTGYLFETEVKEAVLQHHERLDGTGYPRKLCEPCYLSRIIAAADSYDAITFGDRTYQKAMASDKAISLLKSDKGYDPRIVDALQRIVS
jgi:putative nucleotidyltransferase with HDIG domain